MADVSYPQLPTTVWYGVHQILKRTPKRKLDDSILAVELGVQQTAAKQYLRQFVILGLLEEDGSPTALADRWRQDDATAIADILAKAYPQALLDLAPSDGLDRAKIVRWFTAQGLGSGAAGNKAATYMMIAKGVLGEDVGSSAPFVPRRRSEPAANREPARQKPSTSKSATPANRRETGTSDTHQKRPDLNVNVQIHISADATSEQIETIFAAMKRYFNDAD
jgi:hypothetical protein